MLLSNGKRIEFTDKEVRYGTYIYPIDKFAKAKTLGVIVDDLTPECASKMLDICYKYYIKYARMWADIKHNSNGNKRTTRYRDGKDVIYGTYKSICIQVKKLHQELVFQKKYNGNYEDYKLLPYPKIEESEEVENSI